MAIGDRAACGLVYATRGDIEPKWSIARHPQTPQVWGREVNIEAGVPISPRRNVDVGMSVAAGLDFLPRSEGSAEIMHPPEPGGMRVGLASIIGERGVQLYPHTTQAAPAQIDHM